MALISNFSSVLEIAFAVNVGFFLFNASPTMRKALDGRLKEVEELREKKAELKGRGETFPIFFLVGSMFSEFNIIMRGVTVFLSLSSLIILIVSGFFPQMSAPGWVIIIGLMIFLFTTPVLCVAEYCILCKYIGAEADHLHKEIEAVYDRRYEKQ